MAENSISSKPFDPYRALRELPLQASSVGGISPAESLDGKSLDLQGKDSDIGLHASFEQVLAGVVDTEIDGLQKISDLMEKDSSSLESASNPRREGAHFDPRPNIQGFYDSKSTPHDWGITH